MKINFQPLLLTFTLSLVCSRIFAATDQLSSVIIDGGATFNKTSYNYLRQDPTGKTINDWDWTSHYNTNESSPKKSFDYLQTEQYVMAAPISSNALISIADVGGQNNCAEMFYNGQQKFIMLNHSYNATTDFGLVGPTAQNPIHITFIPYFDSTAACAVAPSNLAANQALATWISSKVTLPSGTCSINTKLSEANLTYGKPYNFDSTNQYCVLDKPQWSLESSGSSNDPQMYLVYSGTLKSMITAARPINIYLGPSADVQLPLTTEYVRYPTSLTTADPTCVSDLANYNSGAAAFPYIACGLSNATFNTLSEDYQRSYTYSESFAESIHIFGPGRIDGTTIIAKYTAQSDGAPNGRPCHQDLNLGSIAACYIPGHGDSGKDFVNFAAWRIDTSMLGLSSAYAPKDNAGGIYNGSDPAILINGITVSNTPKRNRGVVQLNVAQFGLRGDRDANNQPVQMNDFKQVGVWTDASDGPDIGSDGSSMQNMYFNVNDDSIKIAAKNQSYKNVTLLQGNVGGIMLGMYGVTRDGIDGSMVTNVYVPRIIELQDTETFWDPYYATHGVVSSRTCPRYFQNNAGMSGNVMPSISNASVQNVHVFALTNQSNPSFEPNTIDSLVSLGVAADGYYCNTNFDTGNLSASYTFGPIHISQVVSDVEPQQPLDQTLVQPYQKPFRIYDSPGDTTQITWGTLDFGSNSNGAAKYLEIVNLVPDYFYACALPSENTTTKCVEMDSSGNLDPVQSNQENIYVWADALPKANIEQVLQYPVMSGQ